jgi:hypothetical protein
MKKFILLAAFALISNLGISQCCKDSKKVNQPWALSASLGYISVSNTTIGPRYQSNTWGSFNISYSTRKWTFGAWAGANYWVNGKQPDLRLGVTTTYTIKKW